MKRSMISAAILGTLGLSSAFTTMAAPQTITLCAGVYEKTVATPPAIPMWGYTLGGMVDGIDGKECVNKADLSSPGPRIIVGDNKDGLDITLYNTLPRTTSLVIPGTMKGMKPQYFTAPDGTSRVRSFDHEVDNGQSRTYKWKNLQPGSYMYHSGTNPQVQVQMGLYGAVTDNLATGVGGAGTAYPGQTFDQEVILFYSEIDRAIHDAVDAGEYNTTDMKSTIDYNPKHNLVEVDATSTFEFNDMPAVMFAPVAENVLVRFFNAGLRIHVPTLYEADFDIIAEDGKQYPNIRKQHTLRLAPLKTKDAMLNVDGLFDLGIGGHPDVGARRFRLTDSAMAVSNPVATAGPVITLDDGEIANGTDNGMVVNMFVAPPADYVPTLPSGDQPKAVRDNMSVVEGGSISNIMASAKSNDTNASGTTVSILSYPKYGELTNNGGGNFDYQHSGGERTTDSLMYALTNAAGESSSAGIKIEVTAMNDAPVATDDTVSAKVGQLIEIRPLDNDTDADSAELTIDSVGTSALGSLEIAGKVIVFNASAAGSDTVSYTISDPQGADSTADIVIAVAEATEDATYTNSGAATSGRSAGGSTGGVAPEAEDDHYVVQEGAVLDLAGNGILGLLSNDSQGAKVSTSLVEYPQHGMIEVFEDGTFVYTHNGLSQEDDQFQYEIYNDSGSDIAEVSIKISARDE
ncbi:MAG: hypothetical protein GY806_07840 [Gammaproteobacteria bacterium]|nr:hypothetical protein [Gammaproteobacteria bacterium]